MFMYTCQKDASERKTVMHEILMPVVIEDIDFDRI